MRDEIALGSLSKEQLHFLAVRHHVCLGRVKASSSGWGAVAVYSFYGRTPASGHPASVSCLPGDCFLHFLLITKVSQVQKEKKAKRITPVIYLNP